MQDIHINKDKYNLSLLNSQIIAALGDMTTGVSTAGTQITVHLTDEANSEDMLIAAQTVEAHDYNDKSPDQLATAAREARLTFQRASYWNKLLDVSNSSFQDLALRINWLQDELESDSE